MTTTETTTQDATDDRAGTIRLSRDGAPPLRFRGWLRGEASSREHNGPSSSRWTTIEIYATAAGKAVIGIVGHSLWQGETTRHSAIVLPTFEDTKIAKALSDQNDGYLSAVAKAAMDNAGLDYAEDIE